MAFLGDAKIFDADLVRAARLAGLTAPDQKVNFKPSCMTRLLSEPTKGLPAGDVGRSAPAAERAGCSHVHWFHPKRRHSHLEAQ